MFAALGSKKLKALSGNHGSEIFIWTLDDNYSVSTYSCMGEEYTESRVGKWIVKVSSTVITMAERHRSLKLPNETGGVLLGTFDHFRNILYITDIILSPDDSIESPTSYIRGCRGLPETICDVEKITAGNITYVGEWHTHPGANTQMSSDDCKLLSVIGEYNAFNSIPAAMMIIGSSGHSIYLSDDIKQPKQSVCKIRMFNMPVSAGHGEFVDNEDYVWLDVEGDIPTENHFALRISGDSMTPKYADGQIVLVRMQDYLEPNDIGIVFYEGNAYCKQLVVEGKTTSLVSLNSDYKPIPIHNIADIHVSGKVVQQLFHYND